MRALWLAGTTMLALSLKLDDGFAFLCSWSALILLTAVSYCDLHRERP